MFFKYTVPVPVAAGKISRQKSKSGTYILYVISRQYDPTKKHTVPVRAMIGKVSDEKGMMFPNEKFFEYFPDTPLPELRPAAERSCALMAGTFMAIEEVVNHHRLDELLAKHFGDRAGLVLDLASYIVIDGRNQGQYYPDYTRVLLDWVTISELITRLRKIMLVKEHGKCRLLHVTQADKDFVAQLGYPGLFDSADEVDQLLSAKRLADTIRAAKAAAMPRK